MKVGILGSGFGLYGYLPSIIKLNWTPLVLQKSYNAIILRPELNRFAESVLMFNEVSEMIEESDNLVVATPPVNQQRILEGLIPFSGHLFLEKPLAADINSHAELIQQLDVSSQDFSVAYLLKYTKHYQEIVEHILRDSEGVVHVDWRIRPRDSNWKNDLNLGGGLFSFYGIHFSELLFDAQVKISDVQIKVDSNCISISVTKAEKLKFQLTVSYSDKSEFSIAVNDKLITKQDNPFGQANLFGKPDNRIDLLSKYLNEFPKASRESKILLEEYVLRLRVSFEEALKEHS
jgi:hypothetical protein